jgi:spermidine/putrescine transport system permease protein
VAIVVISFWSRGTYGQLVPVWTLENYKRFLGFGLLEFDPVYPLIILRSLALGAATTVLCVAAGLPLAFFIAGLPEQNRNTALTLVIIPFWTNLLVRTYAWQLVLPPGTPAVLVGMTCDYLPFLVLPLYASVEKMDGSLAEAARDLHAPPVRVFWHAVLPQIAPGLVAGVILVFIPATGQFVIPDLLGGAKTVMLGNVIAQQFGSARDWPFGSAIAFLAMSLVMAGLWLYARAAGERAQETLL